MCRAGAERCLTARFGRLTGGGDLHVCGALRISAQPGDAAAVAHYPYQQAVAGVENIDGTVGLPVSDDGQSLKDNDAIVIRRSTP